MWGGGRLDIWLPAAGSLHCPASTSLFCHMPSPAELPSVKAVVTSQISCLQQTFRAHVSLATLPLALLLLLLRAALRGVPVRYVSASASFSFCTRSARASTVAQNPGIPSSAVQQFSNNVTLLFWATMQASTEGHQAQKHQAPCNGCTQAQTRW